MTHIYLEFPKRHLSMSLPKCPKSQILWDGVHTPTQFPGETWRHLECSSALVHRCKAMISGMVRVLDIMSSSVSLWRDLKWHIKIVSCNVYVWWVAEWGMCSEISRLERLYILHICNPSLPGQWGSLELPQYSRTLLIHKLFSCNIG